MLDLVSQASIFLMDFVALCVFVLDLMIQTCVAFFVHGLSLINQAYIALCVCVLVLVSQVYVAVYPHVIMQLSQSMWKGKKREIRLHCSGLVRIPQQSLWHILTGTALALLCQADV